MHRRSVLALPLRATIEFPGSNPLVIFVICESRGFYALCLVKLSALGAIGRFSCSAESRLTCVKASMSTHYLIMASSSFSRTEQRARSSTWTDRKSGIAVRTADTTQQLSITTATTAVQQNLTVH